MKSNKEFSYNDTCGGKYTEGSRGVGYSFSLPDYILPPIDTKLVVPKSEEEAKKLQGSGDRYMWFLNDLYLISLDISKTNDAASVSNLSLTNEMAVVILQALYNNESWDLTKAHRFGEDSFNLGNMSFQELNRIPTDQYKLNKEQFKYLIVSNQTNTAKVC